MSDQSTHHRGSSVVLLSFLVFLAAVAGCGDDDPAGPSVPPTGISGRVVAPEGGAASGAVVYLSVITFPGLGTAPTVIDSLLTGDSGRYAFPDLTPGQYQTYAGAWNDRGDDFAEVSPFSPQIQISDKILGGPADLVLHPLKRDGVVAGTVFYRESTRLVPADSTDIMVYRYLGAGSVLEAEGLTDDEGRYALPGIRTGNYAVIANKVFDSDAPFPLVLAARSEVFFCAGDDLAKVEDLVLHDTLVEKPAVYIYPREPGMFKVELGMGPGVHLAASDPAYGDGWSVFVDGDGRMEGTWDYLFYEVGLRGSPRIGTGWCLAWSGLFEGLARITADLGLNAAEREDFLAYWRERLPRRDFYEVHPVVGTDLDAWVTLNVDPAPDTTLRFWLFFEGRDDQAELVPPELPTTERNGTTVVEWGGALLP
jgi:hypothetical protein